MSGAVARSVDVLTFEEVYLRHADDVFRFCLFQLRDWTAAQDVAHDAFTSAFAEYDRVRPAPDQVRIWLIRIARNDVIDYQRRAKRLYKVVNKLRGQRHTSTGDVEGTVQINDQVRGVLQTLKSLSSRDQLLVGLRCAADLSFDEIGRLTGMSTDTAAKATNRAIHRVRAPMEGTYDG
jgi:RNA polymerase sigma-70 factor (ECF subfamily)